MGDWYTIGLFAGLGVAIGILAAGVFPRRYVAPILAAIVGLGIGLLVENWQEALAGFIGGFLGGARRGADRRAARSRRGGTRGGLARARRRCGAVARRARVRAGGRLPRGGRAARARAADALRASPSATRACARSRVTERPPKPVVLIVIDGLTPSMLEATDTPGAPLPARARRLPPRDVSTFPSLTPVCLASIATGAHPDVHGIPHLVWWNRERAAARRVRLVVRRAARRRARPGAPRHGREPERAPPLAERRDGLRGARGRRPDDRGDQHHDLPRPAPPPAARSRASRPCTGRSGSSSTASTSPTGPARRSPSRNRALGSIDAYAAAVGRWLVTRDGFDLLVYYLPDYDYASHALGPDAAHEALARSGRLGRRALRRRRAGPTSSSSATRSSSAPTTARPAVERSARLDGRGRARRPRRTARRCSTATIRGALAEALDGEPSVDVALFLEDGEVVARRGGDEDRALLDAYPDGRAARRARALRNPNAGEVLVSAAPGWEFADLAGRHHVGGGSHGSLAAADSEVPMLTIGLGEPPASITGIKALVLEHFGVAVARTRAA